MKGESDIKFSEMRENMSDCPAVVIEPECKRMKPDVLMEMGLAMLDDEDEPVSAGDSQNSSNSPFDVTETSLLCNVNEEVSSFTDPFGDDYTLYRKQKSIGRTREDYFRNLSDEIVLNIFKWLPKKTLNRCSLVCRRWRNIARDEVLWTRLDLGSKTLSPGSLADVVKTGVRILRLAQADIPDPVFGNEVFPEDYVSRLQFLDLSMTVISVQGLVSLLTKTKHLVKLSLEHCSINDEVCEAISQNRQLEVLNLAMVYDLTTTGLLTILSSCRRLVGLNLGWTGLKTESLDCLMSCLPPNLSQLNLSGVRFDLLDKHVAQLVTACPKLSELDISDATNITATSIDLLKKLANLEHLSISRCYKISNSPSVVQQLAAIPSLRYLDLFGLVSDKNIVGLRRNLPTMKINKFVFSSIARPTVGIRRTSIWGLRSRDCRD
ncbi:S-phase kinase-associated protein 2 [Frankliniella fusca]|uniref:S-phase kinase-associated protein 2 n=1 Tax=Frankliniella fusca TaxID=407009 RepID=A0AAE1GWH4_9NEOP|nr:S-phase kinase-associated protein 2 [Frankliniella fusca]